MQVFTDDDLRVLIPLIKEAIRQAITDAGAAADAKVKVVSDRLDRLVDGSASEAIDTFNEIEAFLRGITDTESLTGLLQQLRAAIETQLTDKVDKVEGKALSTNDYTDTDRATVEAVADERKQFNIFGYRHSLNGYLHTESDAYFNSGKVLINREYPITVYGAGTPNIAAIAFYSAYGTFIKSHAYPDFKASKIVCAAEDIPSGAAYFMASSVPSKAYYWQNGPTSEARENATADAIASLQAWQGNQYHVKGYVYVEASADYGSDRVLVDEISLTTPLIPINRSYPIVNYTSGHANNAATIALYDANGGLIGAINRRINNNLPGALLDYADDSGLTFGTTTIPADAIPPHAVYFRCGAMRENKGLSWYSNGPTQEAREGAVSEAIISSKELAFIDLWNAAAGPYGRYNPSTGYFELNGLTDITYAEALNIYNITSSPITDCGFSNTDIRTNLYLYKRYTTSLYGTGWDEGTPPHSLFRGSNIEIARIQHSQDGIAYCSTIGMFDDCNKLRKVIGIIGDLNQHPTREIRLRNCTLLEEIKIHRLRGNLDIHWSPLLTLDSLQYTVENRFAQYSPTITITVHPDVYAKLTGDTSNAAAAALTPEELAQWTALIPQATEKNIQFATTE